MGVPILTAAAAETVLPDVQEGSKALPGLTSIM